MNNWYNKYMKMDMKRGFFVILVAFVFFFALFQFTGAATPTSAWRKAFGGKIINAMATEIADWESAGYACAVYGDTFDIASVYGPTGPYLVPTGVIAMGGGTTAPSKWTLGFYNSTKTTIATCVLEGETPIIQTVSGYTINLFGVSKL